MYRLVQVQLHVPHRSNCFEVFGFDILVDANLKAWLIEVNTCPSLGCSSLVDRQVKFPMISDLLHMIGVVPYSKAALLAASERARKASSSEHFLLTYRLVHP